LGLLFGAFGKSATLRESRRTPAQESANPPASLRGETAGPESFEAAAVRELAEETGQIVAVEDAHPIAILADDTHGVPRPTAAVRVTGWSGRLNSRRCTPTN
jgi:8-oxo-dGTP pyrophosphatase MutT (NUDIX family)